MGTGSVQETSSPTESDRPLGARFMGGAGLEVFPGVSVATAPEHLRVLLMDVQLRSALVLFTLAQSPQTKL